MDEKRMWLAIAVSLAIIIGFQFVIGPLLPQPAPPPPHAVQVAKQVAKPVTPAVMAKVATPAEGPRVAIDAPAITGSISLIGARIDDLVLRDYHTTIDPRSPLVRVLSRLGSAKPYYVQFGWSVAPGEQVALPTNETRWTASALALSLGHPVTLSWNNGAGLTFAITLAIDDHYMLTVDQLVTNTSFRPVMLYPWSLVRRDYQPKTLGYYILHEGPLAVMHGTLKEMTYSGTKSAAKDKGGTAWESTAPGGWAGITDKYWLVALIPGQHIDNTVAFRHFLRGGKDGYQVDFIAAKPKTVAAGANASDQLRVFVGAKVVGLLDAYAARDHIPSFDKAVDFGWFYFLTKPIFFALDWLNRLLGNFGLAIIVFTVLLRALFFPLAHRSYRSMSKMKLLSPKMQAIRERFKNDPMRQQQEIMALYKAEKINPAAGCLPMLLQIPVFFSLYKVIFVTIEMRQAPFFGWIRDLSTQDPTNVFNLFGLLPWQPDEITPFLHIGAWPFLMGLSMWLQQRVNPPPADPTQARIFQMMPIVFTFMLAHFPVGLVIYYTFSNLLTSGQQWLITRATRAEHAPHARRRFRRTAAKVAAKEGEIPGSQ